MATGEAPRYQIVNAYDAIVREQVKGMMDKTEMCRCEKCYLDICAMVFNKGFVRFVTTREGELFTKLLDMNPAKHVELTVAVTEAIGMVKEKPNHT